MTPTGDVTKLPKWAQHELSRLRGHIRYLEGKLGEGPEDSDTFLDNSILAPDRPLGVSPTIRFELKDKTIVQARVEDNKLLLSCRDGVLSVVPQASNCVRIGKGEYV